MSIMESRFVRSLTPWAGFHLTPHHQLLLINKLTFSHENGCMDGKSVVVLAPLRIARLLTLLWQMRESTHMAGYRAGVHYWRAAGLTLLAAAWMSGPCVPTRGVMCSTLSVNPILVGVQFRSGFLPTAEFAGLVGFADIRHRCQGARAMTRRSRVFSDCSPAELLSSVLCMHKPPCMHKAASIFATCTQHVQIAW